MALALVVAEVVIGTTRAEGQNANCYTEIMIKAFIIIGLPLAFLMRRFEIGKGEGAAH